MVKFSGELIAVSVKTKKTKAGTEGEEVEKIGRLTIEFDGDSVDVAGLAELVSGRRITLELDDPQRRLWSGATVTVPLVVDGAARAPSEQG